MHHIVSGLTKRDVFDPVDHVDLAQTRITAFVHPRLWPAWTGVVSGRDLHRRRAKFILQLAQIPRAKPRVVFPVRRQPRAAVGLAQHACDFLCCGGHQLHQPQRPDRAADPDVELAFAPRNRQRQGVRHRQPQIRQTMSRIVDRRHQYPLGQRRFRQQNGVPRLIHFDQKRADPCDAIRVQRQAQFPKERHRR